jgi:hypothetical protein
VFGLLKAGWSGALTLARERKKLNEMCILTGGIYSNIANLHPPQRSKYYVFHVQPVQQPSGAGCITYKLSHLFFPLYPMFFSVVSLAQYGHIFIFLDNFSTKEDAGEVCWSANYATWDKWAGQI